MNWYNLIKLSARPAKPKSFTDQQVIDLYNEGLNFWQIANRLNTYKSYIKSVLIKNNIPLRTIENNQTRQTNINTEILKNILNMFANGTNIPSISNITGIGNTPIYRIFAKLGLGSSDVGNTSKISPIIENLPQFNSMTEFSKLFNSSFDKASIPNLISDYKSGMKPQDLAVKYKIGIEKVIYYLVNYQKYHIKPDSTHYKNPQAYSLNPKQPKNTSPNVENTEQTINTEEKQPQQPTIEDANVPNETVNTPNTPVEPVKTPIKPKPKKNIQKQVELKSPFNKTKLKAIFALLKTKTNIKGIADYVGMTENDLMFILESSGFKKNDIIRRKNIDKIQKQCDYILSVLGKSNFRSIGQYKKAIDSINKNANYYYIINNIKNKYS